MSNRRLALIDMGTNTFHLLITEVDAGGELTPLVREKVAVKLGEGGISNGEIMPEAWERAIGTLTGFKQQLDAFGVSEVKVLATSAVRNAANGVDFVIDVFEQTGLRVEIITGDREAELIYHGVKSAVDIGPETALVMDIGGGSVEFIIGNQQQLFWKQSFEIGAQRLLDMFYRHDPITRDDVNAEKAYLQEQLQPLTEAVQRFHPTLLIGSSGTFDTLCDIDALKRGYNRQEHFAPYAELPVDRFYKIFAEIVQKNHDERLQIPGMLPMRVDMIVVAVVLVDFVLQTYRLHHIKASAYALKEGMLRLLLSE